MTEDTTKKGHDQTDQYAKWRRATGATRRRPVRSSVSRVRPALVLIHVAVFVAVIDAIQFSANGYVEPFLIGSYHFFFNDLAVLLTGMAIAANSAAIKLRSSVGRAALVFVVIELFWLARGIEVNAFSAVITFRYLADFMTFSIYFLIVCPKPAATVWFLDIFAFGTVVYAALFLARLVYGPDLFLQDRNIISILSLYLENRAIDAYGAAFLGCCAILFFHTASSATRDTHARRYYLLFGIAFGVELLSRQRTASVATLVGFVGYFICQPKSWSRLPLQVRFLAVGAAVSFALTTLMLSSQSLTALLPRDFAQSLGDTATLNARQDIWRGALQEFDNRSLSGMLFGEFAGYSPPILTTVGAWRLSLHNQFIQTLSNLGIVGIGAFGGLIAIGLFSALWAAWQHKRANMAGIPPAVAVSWLLLMITFGYAYEWSELISLFAVMACSPWHENVRISSGSDMKFRRAFLKKSVVGKWYSLNHILSGFTLRPGKIR